MQPSKWCRVLVVDDDADAVESLRDFLALEGYDGEGAVGAEDGVRAALAMRPGVVVAGARLFQSVDGVLLARRLRQKMGRAVVMVAFTGWPPTSDAWRSVADDFDHYVAKPESDDLLSLLGALGARPLVSS